MITRRRRQRRPKRRRPARAATPYPNDDEKEDNHNEQGRNDEENITTTKPLTSSPSTLPLSSNALVGPGLGSRFGRSGSWSLSLRRPSCEGVVVVVVAVRGSGSGDPGTDDDGDDDDAPPNSSMAWYSRVHEAVPLLSMPPFSYSQRMDGACVCACCQGRAIGSGAIGDGVRWTDGDTIRSKRRGENAGDQPRGGSGRWSEDNLLTG